MRLDPSGRWVPSVPEEKTDQSAERPAAPDDAGASTDGE
jgi:hypothetical protein